MCGAAQKEEHKVHNQIFDKNQKHASEFRNDVIVG